MHIAQALFPGLGNAHVSEVSNHSLEFLLWEEVSIKCCLVLLVVLQYGSPSTGVSAPTLPSPGEVDHAVEVPLLGCLVLQDLVLE